MTVIVRRANLDDVKQVAKLFNAYRIFYERKPDLDLALRFITERMDNSESVIFLAQNQDSDALGFTQLYPTFSSVSACSSWVLNDLFVSANARRLGVGKKLMDAARQFAIDSGANGIALETGKDNVNAQALYKSLGYEKNQNHLFYFLDFAS